MTWLAWSLVIFLTALVTLLGTAVLTGRQPRIPLDRLADLAPLPGELPRAGRLALVPRPGSGGQELFGGNTYGPFPVDTGPLLIVSETTAAGLALNRQIEQWCAEAEAKIPPRWR